MSEADLFGQLSLAFIVHYLFNLGSELKKESSEKSKYNASQLNGPK